MEHPAARRFFMRYRMRPAMSDLREPIYESLAFSAYADPERVASIDAAVRLFL